LSLQIKPSFFRLQVSYNAAGVLAHMASDGAAAWTIAEPSREDVLSRMVDAIEKWTINTSRNINYRSFEPILRLVRVEHTPQCQHWAVWALANLTRVDCKIYKVLVSVTQKVRVRS
jgi:Zyg-11 family protein